MTKSETKKILAVIKVFYPDFCKGQDGDMLNVVVDAWYEMLKDYEYNIVNAAVKSLVACDEKGFAPVVGAVISKINLITQPHICTEQEAWGLVLKAIRNSGYNSVQEFEKLPENLKAIVGSAKQLKEWSLTQIETVNTVVASNFQRSFRNHTASNKEMQKLPSDIRTLIAGVSEKMKLGE